MKRLLFLIVPLLISSQPAKATPTVAALFSAIKATGTEVVADTAICNDGKLLGIYQYIEKQLDRLTICIANHKGDSAELRDTILHEAVHVAQACKGDHIFDATSIVKVASADDVVFLNQRYPQEQFIRELEARVIARDQDEVYVTNLIKEHCK